MAVTALIADRIEDIIRSRRDLPLREKWIGLWLRLRDKRRQELASLPAGGTVRCDFSIPYEAMIWLGEEELPELSMLRFLLREGDIFLDCGANVGLWTIVAAKTVGPAGLVHAFEPNPDTFARLRQNLELSEVQNVRAHNCALGSHVGKVSMDASGAHNLCHVSKEHGTLTVPMTTLDEVVETGRERVSGMKIDVEGYELAVLRGAKHVLAEHRPWIVVEFNSTYASTRCLGEWDVHEILTGHGYGAYTISKHHTLAPANPERLVLRTSYCNLFYATREVIGSRST